MNDRTAKVSRYKRMYSESFPLLLPYLVSKVILVTKGCNFGYIHLQYSTVIKITGNNSYRKSKICYYVIMNLLQL